MQLLAKMKRKNSSEKTDQPLKSSIPSAPTDHKLAHTSPRSGFKIFIRSMSANSTPSTTPNSTSPSSPSAQSTTLPSHPPPGYQAVAPPSAAPASTPAAAATAMRPRQLVRVPSVLYCPVLEKDGKGYGNEKTRRTTEF